MNVQVVTDIGLHETVDRFCMEVASGRTLLTTNYTSTNMDNVIEEDAPSHPFIGLLMSTVSAILVGGSFILQKKGVLRGSRNYALKDKHKGFGYLQQGMWWLGMFSSEFETLTFMFPKDIPEARHTGVPAINDSSIYIKNCFCKQWACYSFRCIFVCLMHVSWACSMVYTSKALIEITLRIN
ncbi:unnamed protein product [Clavelina lepadiformis]|uniref:Magnesium transporter n=1 Tax=Clavelina lepadiformis TaxID=159417 RepID=A0ABP0FNH2_CLALP